MIGMNRYGVALAAALAMSGCATGSAPGTVTAEPGAGAPTFGLLAGDVDAQARGCAIKITGRGTLAGGYSVRASAVGQGLPDANNAYPARGSASIRSPNGTVRYEIDHINYNANTTFLYDFEGTTLIHRFVITDNFPSADAFQYFVGTSSTAALQGLLTSGDFVQNTSLPACQ